MRLLTAALFWVLSSAAQAASSYTVRAFPDTPGLVLQAMNNHGEVAGYIYTTFPQAAAGTIDGIGLVPLPDGASASIAFAINDSGFITGYVTVQGASHSFIGTPSAIRPVPLLSGWNSASGLQININGIVTGGGYRSSGEAPFVAAGLYSFPLPIPSNATQAAAESINNSADFAGVAQVGDGILPYIGTPLRAATIPMPAGWSLSAGGYININDGDFIAGQANNGNVTQAFYGNRAGIRMIPPPEGASNAGVYGANFLSDSQFVVGNSDSGNGWIWDPVNGTRLLTGLVPSGWIIYSATSVNQQGQVLATGSLNQGPITYLLLTPVR